MNTARRDSWLVAAVVVVALVALVVVGRLQTGHLPEGDARGSQPTKRTVRTDAPPVASGLAVAGRVALSGQVEAVAVGEDAVWVLLAQCTLLRVDPERHRVTGRLELGVPPGMTVGPLAVGAGAVWVGMRDATVTVRVDPVRLRVTGRLDGRVAVVARGVVWSYCCRRGDDFMRFGRVDAGTLRPRRPLVVTDAAGRRQPVGWLAFGPPGVWTVAFGFRHQRLWRVPLGGGPARPVARVDGGIPGPARVRRWRWCRLGGRSGLGRVTRSRDPAAGGSRLGAGGRVAARPARVLPGCAGGRAARGMGGHSGARAPARGCRVALGREDGVPTGPPCVATRRA